MEIVKALVGQGAIDGANGVEVYLRAYGTRGAAPIIGSAWRFTGEVTPDVGFTKVTWRVEPVVFPAYVELRDVASRFLCRIPADSWTSDWVEVAQTRAPITPVRQNQILSAALDRAIARSRAATSASVERAVFAEQERLLSDATVAMSRAILGPRYASAAELMSSPANAAARNAYCSCGDLVPDYCVRTGDRCYCSAVCAEKSEAYKLGLPTVAVCATDTNATIEARYQAAVAALNVAHGRPAAWSGGTSSNPLEDIRKAADVIANSWNPAPAPKPALPADGSRWKLPGDADFRVVLRVTDETVDLLPPNKVIERVKRSNWPGEWLPFDPATASKVALPAIGSRWKHSGKGDAPRSQAWGGWAVVVANTNSVELEKGITRYSMPSSSWPGEWSPDEQVSVRSVGIAVCANPGCGISVTIATMIHGTNGLAYCSTACAGPGPYPTIASNQPPILGKVTLTSKHKGPPPLTPAEAVERAVREAPSSLNKQALRAALVNDFGAWDSIKTSEPRELGVRLCRWLNATKEERLSDYFGDEYWLGTAYEKTLAAIQAPKMHRPARWTGGCDKGRSPR